VAFWVSSSSTAHRFAAPLDQSLLSLRGNMPLTNSLDRADWSASTACSTSEVAVGSRKRNSLRSNASFSISRSARHRPRREHWSAPLAMWYESETGIGEGNVSHVVDERRRRRIHSPSDQGRRASSPRQLRHPIDACAVLLGCLTREELRTRELSARHRSSFGGCP
jgi:hypothetical protein